MQVVVLVLVVALGVTVAFVRPNAMRTSTKSALNVIKLEVQDDSEPIENVIKRFKRSVNQSGHLMEMRHRELWETAADKRKRKATRARQLQRIERTNDRYERIGNSEYNS
jgi:small subunit ribosomal protein S21